MAVPTVSGVAPAVGTGGTSVVLTGSGFTGATAVAFDSAAATAYSVDADTQITATVPNPSVSGSVGVIVTTPDGNSSGSTVQFAYASCDTARFDVPLARSGCVTEANGSRQKAGERFKMEIDFSTTGNFMASCGEYRQYIRGSFTVNGKALTHLMPNAAGGAPVPMLPRPAAGDASDNFLEDGIASPSAGVNAHYGHRSEGSTDSTDTYLSPDRATGSQYRGNDFPGITAAAGTAYGIDLDFRGAAIDVCNANAVVKQNEWTVSCSGTL